MTKQVDKDYPFKVKATQNSPWPTKGPYLRSAAGKTAVIYRFKTKTAHDRYLKEAKANG